LGAVSQEGKIKKTQIRVAIIARPFVQWAPWTPQIFKGIYVTNNVSLMTDNMKS